MQPPPFSCGHATFVGAPNAGKSTLLNRLLDHKLSIVTPKPQTTRKKITGIYHDDRSQIIILDTPGIMDPKQSLHESMLEITRRSLRDTDVIVALIPLQKGEEPFDRAFADELIEQWVRPADKPFVIALNKADLVPEETVHQVQNEIMERYHPIAVPALSALTGSNIQELIDLLRPLLPLDEPIWPDDILSTEPERFFVGEIIREKIFLQFGREIPYSTEVVIDEFKEQHENDPSKKDLIRCSIIVERNSQKQIIIGQKGAAIKKLGQAARKEIEELLDRPVFLEIFVKIRPDWRKKKNLLKSYGY
ncbi:GTP-binding protein Era [Chlorobaculum parvum NCIB 8327]|uniref:GTPase Era n=1 Tax=Chlorobaculum parvum (strain DSM 263 / NCIMB 8327) TaxID=517417 RepID=B3QQD5_CHLP8|nr:GTPase Era [Chlorobaculum parvum]ACF12138.1 GTP-binding protein Era [Chlorobaculum parvum NCIB 8327]